MRSNESLQPIATRLGVEVAAVGAVLDVESSGSAMCDDRPVIRFEVHKFWDHCSADQRKAMDGVFHVVGREPWNPTQSGRWRGHQMKRDGVWVWLHKPGKMSQTQALEYEALARAKQINADAAVLSTSYGLAQILGEHWIEAGFGSIAEFEAAQGTEEGQIESFIALVQNTPRFLDPLRRLDWKTFARNYNGPGQPDYYAKRLAEAFAARGGGEES